MAISTVRVQMNGNWYNLAEQSDGSWQATLTAPNTTSFNLDGGYYPLDTTVPKIKSAVANPNPVDAGATMIITVVVE